MRSSLKLLACGSLLVLAGAGCAQTTPNAPVPANAPQPVADCATQLAASSLVLAPYLQQPYSGDTNGDYPAYTWEPISPQADLYAADSANVEFQWKFSPAVSAACESGKAWSLLRSASPDPVFDGKTVSYQSDWASPSSSPNDLTSGTWYFRACLGSKDPLGCDEYSNTIKVRIP